MTRRFAFIVDKEITFFNKIIAAMQISLSTCQLVNYSINFILIFHLGQLFVGLLYLLTQCSFVGLQLFGNGVVDEGEHFYGQDGGVHGAINAHSGNGDARRHLYD